MSPERETKTLMPSFAYRVKAEPARVASGRIEAGSQAEAVAELRKLGYAILSVAEVKPRSRQLRLNLGRRVRRRELTLAWRGVAGLLEAGVPLPKALNTVAEQTPPGYLREVLSGLREQLENATSLSEAMSRHPEVFGPLSVGVVESGEATGQLGRAAEQLAERSEREEELRGRMAAALVYPGLLALVGGLVVVVLIVAVMPRFLELFQSLGQQLPWPTRLLLSLSSFARSYWWFLGGFILAGLVIGHRFLRQDRTRLAIDRVLLQMPWIGPILRQIEVGRFAQTLATLTASGVPLLEALRISARATGNRALGDDVAQLRDRVAEGSRIDAAMRRGRYFPPGLISMAGVGEDAACLPQMLGRVAEGYQRDSDRVLQALARLLETALVLILGTVVGAIVLAVLMPIYQATASFQ